MSKLISNPTQCGYHDDDEERCMHPKNARVVCFGAKFPTTCPLPDDDPIKPKKRNRQPARSRKDCIHIEEHNGCSAPFVNQYHCIGVNCGRFESKT